MVIILFAGSRNLHQLRGVFRRRAGSESRGGGGRDASAGNAGFELLVVRQAAEVNSRYVAGQGNRGGPAETVGVGYAIAGHRAGDQTRVIAPVETAPQAIHPTAVVGNRVLN